MLGHVSFPSRFGACRTLQALAGSGISCPDLDGYAATLWSYWEDHLDQDTARDPRIRAALEGRTVLITGASSESAAPPRSRWLRPAGSRRSWPGARTSSMQLSCFGATRLVMGLMGRMREQGHGHVVNVSSTGVQTNPPRFSAYVASKAALDSWSNVVASEAIGDGISFTTIHMPLVKTR